MAFLKRGAPEPADRERESASAMIAVAATAAAAIDHAKSWLPRAPTLYAIAS
jgi:hypothetical protein